MQQRDLELLLQRAPSPRLRLHVINGAVFEIDDPDLAVLGRSTVELLLPPADGVQREAVINLLHIIWVEVLSLSS